MVETYLKNNNTYEAFSDWLDESMALKTKAHPLTVHVSSFLKAELTKAEVFECSINIFLELVDKAIERNYIADLMPILAVPLGYSNQLSFWHVSMSVEEQLGDEPPSIYLLEREQLKGLEVTEEYKVPVELDLPKFKEAEFNVYYRCFRDLMAIENGWEFNRVLYIECYPK